jgi:hypothetical protein
MGSRGIIDFGTHCAHELALMGSPKGVLKPELVILGLLSNVLWIAFYTFEDFLWFH